MRTEQDVIDVWTANQGLLHGKIHPLVIEPLSKPPGLSCETDWDYILATFLGRCFDSFRSVQILCNPTNEARLWIDAYILSRSIYEVDVTLRWCNKSTDNLRMFVDDYHLKVARMFDALIEPRKSEVTPERQAQIREREKAVLQRYKRGPGTMSVMIGLEQICRELSDNEGSPNSLWEYNNYYREASSFAHPTMWHLFSYRAKLAPITDVTPSPETGYRALLIAGGCFLRILEKWNSHFKRLPDKQPIEWLADWQKSLCRNRPEAPEMNG